VAATASHQRERSTSNSLHAPGRQAFSPLPSSQGFRAPHDRAMWRTAGALSRLLTRSSADGWALKRTRAASTASSAGCLTRSPSRHPSAQSEK